MFRHPHYLEIPWNLHWQDDPHVTRHYLRRLIAVLAFLAIFLIGVGITSGPL
jgi:hypothetical protein